MLPDPLNIKCLGHVAEWLRSGLQNRLPRFNSGRGLQQNQSLSALGLVGNGRIVTDLSPTCSARGLGVLQSAGGGPTPTRVSAQNRSGWRDPGPLGPPPGVAIADRLMDVQDARDRAQLIANEAQRLAKK